MSDQNATAAPVAAPVPFVPKKRSPLTLIVLLALFAAGIVSLAIDYKARYHFNQARAVLDKYFPENEPGPDDTVFTELPKDTAVHEQIGREPDAIKQVPGGLKVETYRWPGVFYVYTLRVEYAGKSARKYRSASVFRFTREEDVIPEVEPVPEGPVPPGGAAPDARAGAPGVPPGGGPAGQMGRPSRMPTTPEEMQRMRERMQQGGGPGGPTGLGRPGDQPRRRPPGADDGQAPTDDPTAKDASPEDKEDKPTKGDSNEQKPESKQPTSEESAAGKPADNS